VMPQTYILTLPGSMVEKSTLARRRVSYTLRGISISGKASLTQGNNPIR